MREYRHPALRQLKDQQVRFVPAEKLQEQLDRIEKLVTEIDPAKKYPYQYVCFRITEFRPDTYPHLLIDGADLEHDLRLFVEDLSEKIGPIPAETIPEPVFTIEQVSKNLQVSTKTISRWRDRGLVTRLVLLDGRRKVGIRQSLLNRFLEQNKEHVEKSSRFSQLTETEKEEILTRARRMAKVSPDRFMDICRRIAQKVGRSVETIRYTLKKHDQAHPDAMIFPDQKEQLTEQDKAAIYSSFRRGISVDALAKKFQRTRTSVLRIINEVRAAKLLIQPMDYIHHSSFDDPSQAKEILAPMPDQETYEMERQKAQAKVPAGLPPELSPLYAVPLLKREQEAHLFRKMNYLKHRALMLAKKIDPDPSKARSTDLDQLEAFQKEAQAIKELLISANMRLVASIAKKHTGPADNFFELLSDGNLSLMKAVEKFDYSRGFKFSTYASWAIMKNFARSIPEERNRRDRFMTGAEELFEAAADNRGNETVALAKAEQTKKNVHRLLDFLEPRERRIIEMRAGLNQDHGLTLQQVGKLEGITKERVRQLEARGLMKLRSLAQSQNLEWQ
jgi:RNA polymerase sigma factor (sigma-70 family)